MQTALALNTKYSEMICPTHHQKGNPIKMG